MEQLYTLYDGLALLFAVLYLLLIFFSCKGWMKLPVFSGKENSIFSTPVSIIIAARNEEQYIGKCLEALVLQDYPPHLFEIIVVDDHSEDLTVQEVERIKYQNPQVTISLLQLEPDTNGPAYKKKAIARGIESAAGRLIVTTDADCSTGTKWLSTLVAFYETYRPSFIAAPVVFHQEKSVFQKMQSIEFAGLIMSSAAGIYYNKPFICNGANLAYEKQAFYAVNGFEGIDHIASGDDVLLMNKINERFEKSILFLKSTAAIVYTPAKPTAAEFMQQRIRWASKGIKQMNQSTLFVAFTVFGFNLIILLGLMLSLAYDRFIPVFFFLFLLKCISDFLFLWMATSFFKKRKFLFFFLPEQFLYIVYVVLTGFWGMYGRYEWKGRHVKQ